MSAGVAVATADRAGSEAARRGRPAKWPSRAARRAALKTYGKFSPEIWVFSVVLRLMRYVVASVDP